MTDDYGRYDHEPEDSDIGECEDCGDQVPITEKNVVSMMVWAGDRENPPEYEDTVLCVPCQKKQQAQEREAYSAYLNSYAGASIEEDE